MHPLKTIKNSINTVAFRKYLSKSLPQDILTPLNKAFRYNIFTRRDIYNEFELDRMFSIWHSAIWEISSLILMAGNHRSTVIINTVYKVLSLR